MIGAITYAGFIDGAEVVLVVAGVVLLAREAVREFRW
jgi:hypothetical protein